MPEKGSKPDRKQKWNIALNAILNPRFVLCFGIAWMITNGWSYLLILMGMLFGVSWMTVVGSAYAGFLWLPFTPEKIVTLAIAIALLKWLFPKDEKTLLTLRREFESLRGRCRLKQNGGNVHGNAETG